MVFNLFRLFDSSEDKRSKRTSSGSVSVATLSNIQRDWDNISILLKGGQPSQLRQALISADKTLDNALRDMVAGDTMGERLKNSSELFDRDTYNKIWSAHKIRNSLVHESGYEPPHHMLVKGVEDLRTGLRALKIKI